MEGNSMGLLDKIKNMMHGGKQAATSVGDKVQDVAQDHAATVNNALDSVTDKIPGTVDDQIADKAKEVLGTAPADANPAPAPAPAPEAVPSPAPVPTEPAPAPAPAPEQPAPPAAPAA